MLEGRSGEGGNEVGEGEVEPAAEPESELNLPELLGTFSQQRPLDR